jgi:hypothetical protein
VLLFVWSGKRPFKGVCRFMSACYYVTRRSTWELSVRPFLFSNKYRALCERKYKLLGQLKQWDSNEYMFRRYNQSVLYFYTITTIYFNRSKKSSTSISVIAILIYLIGTLRFIIIFPTQVEDVE